MDNASQQVDEISALMSIYGSSWRIESESGNCYSMEVSPDVYLFITLNPNYPSDAPPTYELQAPALSSLQKDKIVDAFKDIHTCSSGNPIIFEWIEKLREILSEIEISKGSETNITAEDNLDDSEKSHTENVIKFEVIHGPTIQDRKSIFQGHVCAVYSYQQVGQVIEYLLKNKKIANATHNIMAYRIRPDNGVLLQDSDDDGENHAGGRLLHLLQVVNVVNVVVIVSRWYGGIHLGPDRFRHINNAARQVLEKAGYI